MRKGCVEVEIAVTCDKCHRRHDQKKPCKPMDLDPFPCIRYKLEADVLIVGGGMAACAFVERITRSGQFSAILIENGPNYNNNEIIRRPLINLQDVHYPEFFYQGTYMPEPSTGNRNNIAYSNGRGLSGGALVFGQVYNRGTEECWNRWIAPSKGRWNAARALNLYKKMEDFREDGTFLPDPSNHGRGGLQPTRLGSADSNAFEQFLAAVQSTKAPGTQVMIPDYNNYAYPVGLFKNWQFFQTTAPVERAFPSKTFLGPKVMDENGKGVNGRKLRVFTKTVGTLLLFDDKEKKNTVRGIFGLRESQPVLYTARETVISAGFHTPQILQINGFGPADVLENAGVKVRADLPGVGNTFRSGPVITVILIPPPTVTPNTQVGTYFCFGAFLPDQRRGRDLNIRKFQLDGAIADGALIGVPGTIGVMSLQPLRPESLGTANIQDKDYTHIQKAYANYYENPDDLDANIVFFQKVFTPAVTYLVNNYKYSLLFPTLETLQDNPPGSLRSFIINNSNNTHHYQCFNKMGDPQDGGVVDASGRVHYARNLRAVDDGTAPYPTDGNTGGTAQVVGLGVAEDMLEEWLSKC